MKTIIGIMILKWTKNEFIMVIIETKMAITDSIIPKNEFMMAIIETKMATIEIIMAIMKTKMAIMLSIIAIMVLKFQIMKIIITIMISKKGVPVTLSWLLKTFNAAFILYLL